MTYIPRRLGERVVICQHDHPGRECTYLQACYRDIEVTYIGEGIGGAGELVESCGCVFRDDTGREYLLGGADTCRIRQLSDPSKVGRGIGWPYDPDPECHAATIVLLRCYLSELASLDATLDHTAPWATRRRVEDAWLRATPGMEGGLPRWQRRNILIRKIYEYAAEVGWPHGIEIDDQVPAFPVIVLVELPTGQASWHVTPRQPFYGHAPDCPCCTDRPHGITWDGHTREEKSERIRQWIESEASG